MNGWTLNPPPVQVEYDKLALGLHCPRCLEPAGLSCKVRSGRRLVRTHIERRLAVLEACGRPSIPALETGDSQNPCHQIPYLPSFPLLVLWGGGENISIQNGGSGSLLMAQRR